MADEQVDDDMRLLGIAYVEFFVKKDKEAMRLLEREARLMLRSMGSIAFFLMDAVVIPVQHGVCWQAGWVEVDFRRRSDPEFAATLLRRRWYRRLAKGYTLMPRYRSRRLAREVAAMLCMAYIAEHQPADDSPVTVQEAVLEKLRELRLKFCQMGDAHRNA